MIKQFLKLFGLGTAVDFKGMVASGALIIDVRTPDEFTSGHIEKAKNIPLDTLATQTKNLPKDKIIITCCASGMRSASAKSLLKSNGFIKVYNGGGWQRLASKI